MGALVSLATTGTLPTMLALVLAVLVAMAEITSPQRDEWSYVVNRFAAPIDVHCRATIVVPALRRAGDQWLASAHRAMDASILAIVGRHRDIASEIWGVRGKEN